MENLISVIVPIYNAEKTLSKCLDSIISQTYNNLEVILINDGSTDKSLEVCNQYAFKDSRLIVVDKQNTGVSDTRNIGIDMARGTFITFVDSDDYIDTNMYEKMLSSIIHNCAEVVACKFNMVHDDYVEQLSEPYIEKAMAGELKYYILNKDSVHGSTCRVLINRSLVGKLRFAKDVKIKEDLLFMVELMKKASNACFVDESLYNYMLADNDADYKKYYKLKYIRDYYCFAVNMFELLKDSGCDDEIYAMLFKQYVEIIKCKIYDKKVRKLKKTFTKEELIFLNNNETYKSYLSQNCSKKSRIFAYLAHKKMFKVLNIMQKIIDVKK